MSNIVLFTSAKVIIFTHYTKGVGREGGREGGKVERESGKGRGSEEG